MDNSQGNSSLRLVIAALAILLLMLGGLCVLLVLRPIPAPPPQLVAAPLVQPLQTAGAQAIVELPIVPSRPANVIDLLPLIRPDSHSIMGNWKTADGTLLIHAADLATLELPYEPPEEYDFRIVFVRNAGNDAVGQILSAQDHSFAWCIAGWNNAFYSFQQLDGGWRTTNESAVRFASCIQNGIEYESVVKVRRSGATAYVNNLLISSVPAYDNLTLPQNWSLRNPKLIGLAVFQSSYVFRKIEVMEITGKGKILPTPVVKGQEF